MREHARFVDQSRRRDMHSHEAGLHTWLSRQECGQSFVLVRINQPINPPFAHAHQIDNCNRSVIERKSERRTVKIPARNHISAFREDEWIISRRRRFNQQHIFAVRQRTAHRAVYLRHATQTVSVLDTRIVLYMRLTNFTSFEKRQQMLCRGSLSSVRPRVLQTSIKRSGSALERLE